MSLFRTPTVAGTRTRQVLDQYSLPKDRSSLYRRARTTGPSKVNYRPAGERQVWENPEIPFETIMSTGITAPAYGLERIFAGLDQAWKDFTNAGPEDPGLIDGVVEGIRSVPFMGQPLGALGDFSEHAMSQSLGSLNAAEARMAEGIWYMPDDAQVPADLIWAVDFIRAAKGTTVAEEKRRLKLHGWTDQDIQAMDRKEKGWFDFPDKKLVEQEQLDLFYKVALDPINLAFFAGRLARTIKAVPRTVRVAQEGARMTQATTKVAPVVETAATATINAGQWRGTTLKGFSRWGMNTFGKPATTGTKAKETLGRLGKGYLASTWAFTGVQASVNTLDHVAGPDAFAGTMFDTMFQFFRKVGDNRPVSHNELVMIASFFTLPSITAMKQGGSAARDWTRTGTIKGRAVPFLGRVNTDLEAASIRHITRGVKALEGTKKLAVRRAWLVDKIGEKNFKALMWMANRGGYERRKFHSNLEINPNKALYNEYYPKSLAEVQILSERVTQEFAQMLEKEVQLRRIKPQHVREGLDDFYFNGGKSLDRATAGVERNVWDAEAFLDHFMRWVDESTKIDAAGYRGLTPAKNTEIASMEGIRAAIDQVRAFAIDGKISSTDLNTILMNEIAIFKADLVVNKGRLIARALSKDLVESNADDIVEMLNKVMNDGFDKGVVATQAELLANAVSWETKALQAMGRADDMNRLLERNGQLRKKFEPGPGAVEMPIHTARRPSLVGRFVAMGDVGTVRELRSLPKNMALESGLANAISNAYTDIVQASSQMVKVSGKIILPAVNLVMDATQMTAQMSREIAVATMLATKATRQEIITRGSQALAAHGLAPNAVEYVWHGSKRLAESEYDALVKLMRGPQGRGFGDRVGISDTGQTIRAIVKNDDTKFASKLDRAIERADAKLGAHETADVNITTIVKKRKATDADDVITIAEVEQASARTTFDEHKRFVVAKSHVTDLVDRPSAALEARMAGSATGPAGSGAASAGGGSGAYRTKPSGAVSRFEASNGGRPWGRRGKYLVDPTDGKRLDAVRGRAEAAWAKTPGSRRASVDFEGAHVFVSPDDTYGAWVTPLHELKLWRTPKSRRPTTGRRGEFLAEVSEYSTRISVAYDDAGRELINELGGHGWVAQHITEGKGTRTVYLLRDLERDAGKTVAIPPSVQGQGGIVSVLRQIPRVGTNRQGRMQNLSVAENNWPSGAAVRIDAIDSEAWLLVERHSHRELEHMTRVNPGDPVAQKALQLSREAPDLTALPKPSEGAGRKADPNMPPKGTQPAPGTWQQGPYADIAESVPISVLKDIPPGNVLGKTNIDELSASLLERGFDEPIIVTYSSKGRTIRLDEGNHRLAAAEKAGLDEVPVRVVRVDREMTRPVGKVVRGIDPDDAGYIPGDLSPSQIMDTTAQASSFSMTRNPHTHMTKTGNVRYNTPKQNASDFRTAALKAKRARGTEGSAGLVVRTAKEYEESILFLSKDGKTGAAVAPNGELVSVFRHPDGKTPIDDVIREITEGGYASELSTYSKTASVFERNGWVPVAKAPFKPALAPKGASAKVHGDVVYMVHPQHLRDDWVGNVVKALDNDAAERAVVGALRHTRVEPPRLTELALQEGTMPPDLVRYIREAEEEMGQFVPNMRDDVLDRLEGLPIPERQKIYRLETEMRRYKNDYRLSVLPQGGITGVEDFGKAYEQMMGGKKAMGDLLDSSLTSWMPRMLDFWNNPVYRNTLARDSQQEMFNELMKFDASPSQVKNFTRKIGKFYDEHQAGIPGLDFETGVRRYRRPDAIPKNEMRRIAREVFDPETINAIKAAGDDIVDITQRSNSRFYRNLKEKFPVSADGGTGSLGGLVERYYGRGGQDSKFGNLLTVNRRAQVGMKAFYHTLRFLADPRWYGLNWFEAEILAITRIGLHARGARNRPDPSRRLEQLSSGRKVKGSEMIGMEDFSPQVQKDIRAGGQMDPRRLSGFRNAVFEYEHPRLVQDFMRKQAKADPAVDDLIRLHGGTVESFADDVVEQLGRFDDVGVRATYNEELLKLGYTGEEAILMRKLTDGLIEVEQTLFKDIQHLFHGNVNRSNLERLANNPMLWWPVSYQLKAGKWLLDIMGDSVLGKKSGWLGGAAFTTMMLRHENLLENDETYGKIWDDHSSAWQTFAMFLPVTPFDLGVYLSRQSRFFSNWLGASLGIGERDPFYPDDPINFVWKAMSVGPFFTAGVVKDIIEQSLDIRVD